MTVSNVLNERFDQMSPATRIRVQAAINKLGYRPHQVARSLRRSEQLSVGLLFIDDDQTFITHPGHSHMVSGLSDFLSRRGYSLTLQGLDPGSLSDALPVKHVGADALCIVQSGPPDRRRAIVRSVASLAQPCVLIHETDAPAAGDFCCIQAADREGGRLLADHLISRGCESLLIFVPTSVWPAMEERRLGVEATCVERGVPFSILRSRSSRFEEMVETLQAYLDQHPVADGILAGNDQFGMAALSVLQARGIPVPARVKVTGFNALEFWKYSNPRLTTIRAPASDIGVRAGEEILSRLRTGRFASPTIRLPVELILGQST